MWSVVATDSENRMARDHNIVKNIFANHGARLIGARDENKGKSTRRRVCVREREKANLPIYY